MADHFGGAGSSGTNKPVGPQPKRRMNLGGMVMAVIFLIVSTVAWGTDTAWLLRDGSKIAFGALIAVIGLYLLFGSRRRSDN